MKGDAYIFEVLTNGGYFQTRKKGGILNGKK